MKRFIEGADRRQVTLLPECLDDFVGEDNPVRIVDAFVNELDLAALGFEGVDPAITGRPSYHPSVLLKLYDPASFPRTASHAAKRLRSIVTGARYPMAVCMRTRL